MLLLSSTDFSNLTFLKKITGALRASNSLDPDQGQHCVSPDLDLNGLQMLSADDKR